MERLFLAGLSVAKFLLDSLGRVSQLFWVQRCFKHLPVLSGGFAVPVLITPAEYLPVNLVCWGSPDGIGDRVPARLDPASKGLARQLLRFATVPECTILFAWTSINYAQAASAIVCFEATLGRGFGAPLER